MMKRTLCILLVICTLSAAMVPRIRKALKMDEAFSLPTTSESPTICAPQTPCGWSVYNSYTHEIIANITNTYCSCNEGFVCKQEEENQNASFDTFKCQAENTLKS